MKSRLGTQVFISYSRNASGASGWKFDSDLEFYRQWCEKYAFDDWFRRSGYCSFVSRASIWGKTSTEVFLQHSLSAIREAGARQTTFILLIDFRNRDYSKPFCSDSSDVIHSYLSETEGHFSLENNLECMTEAQKSVVRYSNKAFGYLSDARRKRVFVMFDYLGSEYAVSGDKIDMLRSKGAELDLVEFKEFSDDHSRRSRVSQEPGLYTVDRDPFGFIEDGNVFSLQRARKRMLNLKKEAISRDMDFELSSSLDDILPDL